MSTMVQPARRQSRSRVLTLALLGIYFAWNFLSWAGQPALETFDSYRYLGDWGLDPVLIFDPLNGGFATSLLYALAPDPTLISLMQVLLSAIAWSLLALATLHRLRGLWSGWVLSVAVLVISMQSVFWSSHFAIGAESLVFSAAVAWLASLVWLTSQSAPGTSAVIATLAGLMLVAVTRPQAMLALIPIQIAMLIWWSQRERHPRTLTYALPAILPIAAFSLFRVWQISQHDRWAFRYALHNLVDKPPSFRAYALERMPPCDAIPAALNGQAPWNDVLALEGPMINQCPETYLWFQSGAASLWNWVPAVPGAALRNFTDVAWNIALIRWNEFIALPRILDSIIMPYLNPWLFMTFCLVIGVTLAIVTGRRPRITPWGILGAAIVICCVLGYTFLVWAADGVDHGRHIYPFLPLVGVAALLMPSMMWAVSGTGVKRKSD